MSYEQPVMSYDQPVMSSDLFYQPEEWRGRGLDQALQRLVERDQRRELEEEQRAAYLSSLLRLLSEAEAAGLVEPGDDVTVLEEEEDDVIPSDYDDVAARGVTMETGRRPQSAWWGLEPEIAQALLDRMEPQVAQTLLQRARQQRLQQQRDGMNREVDQDTLRRVVARLLSGVGPSNNNAVMSSPGRRMRRDVSEPVGPAHKNQRTRRSLDDVAPSNAPPLLRVKRIDPTEEEQMHLGKRRRRRREAAIFDPQILIDQLVEYIRK